jgi:hypothetical protein
MVGLTELVQRYSVDNQDTSSVTSTTINPLATGTPDLHYNHENGLSQQTHLILIPKPEEHSQNTGINIVSAMGGVGGGVGGSKGTLLGALCLRHRC